MIKIGDKVQFTYPNFAQSIDGEGYPEYAMHSGQIVTIASVDEAAFTDGDGNACRGFHVIADDGWEGTVWPGELSTSYKGSANL